MPRLELNIKVATDTRVLISPQEFLNKYAFGISPADAGGRVWDDQTIASIIRDAAAQLENHLDIRIPIQCIEETKDSNLNDYLTWGYMPTTYPAREGFKYQAFVNEQPYVLFPKEWIVAKKSSFGIYPRSLSLIPNTTGALTANEIVFPGVYGYFGVGASGYTPNFFSLIYATGWHPVEIPRDIIDFIANYASLLFFIEVGDILGGLGGISSKSISIDGLSTAISTTQSATSSGLTSRVLELRKTLADNIKNLEKTYKGAQIAVA